MAFRKSTNRHGGPFRFRVSDSVVVPLRGKLLRLRLVDGEPSMADLAPGRVLKLVAPDGAEREVRILDYGVTGGRATQARLERTRELDVVVPFEDAARDGRPVGIGWMAHGPGRARAGA